MHNKWIFIFAFLAVALGLMGLSKHWLAPTEPMNTNGETSLTANTVSPPAIEMVKVWRSKVMLQPGQALKAMQFIAETMPLAQAKREQLKHGQLNFIAGSVSGASIESQALLFEQNIISPTHPEYINLVLKPGMTPYPFQLNAFSIYGGQIKVGDHIDVITLTSKNNNIANSGRISDLSDVAVSPLLIGRRVLAVFSDEASNQSKAKQSSAGKAITEAAELVGGRESFNFFADEPDRKITLVMELSRQDAAKMAIAKRIGIIEIYKSSGRATALETRAATKDVLPDYKTITEFRGNTPVSE